MKAFEKTPLTPVAALAAVAVVLFAIFAASGWRPIVGRDSLGYMEMAEGWRGDGRWMTAHWPPGYPMLLILASAGGARLVGAAAVINLAAYALTGLLAAALATRLARGHTVAALAGALLLLGSTVVLDVHLFAFSEPACLCLQLATCWFAVRYLDRGSARDLAAAAGLAGAAAWVRYAGILLIPPVILLPWFAPRMTDGAARWRHAFLASATAGLMLLGLIVTLRIAGPGASPRDVAWHPPGQRHLRQLGLTVLSWVAPSRWVVASPAAAWAGVALAVCLPVAGAVAGWRSHRPASWLGLQAGAYLLGLIAVVSLADHSTPLDARLLLPYHVSLLLCLAALGSAYGKTPGWRQALPALLLAGAALCAVRGARYLGSRLPGEEGYDSRAWRSAPAVAAVRRVPRDWTVISNAAGALQFQTGRPVVPLPRRYDAVRDKAAGPLEAQLAGLHPAPSRLLLAWFPGESGAGDWPADAVAVALGLPVSVDAGGARLYTCAGLPPDATVGTGMDPR